MKIAIIGAGVSGLANARALHALGYDVRVYEAMPDIGGVWSSTRSYPGVSTQNDKRSYSFSDLPMPADYPEYPSGAQIRGYLQRFAHVNGLEPTIRLNTTVRSAVAAPDGWVVETEGPDGLDREEVDWLILANGICSLPYLPTFPGQAEFEAAGGVVAPPSAVGDGSMLARGDVVVLGWGKSAADLAVAALARAHAVTLVARAVGWKLPKRIGPMPFQRLVLTRLGEHLLWAPHRSFAARVLQKLDAPLRRAMVRRLERAVRSALDLDRRGLVPTSSITGFTHLVTPGFFEAVDEGCLALRTDRTIAALTATDGRPTVRLSDGELLPADVVVAATGYDQDLSVFDARTRQLLLDADGGLRLERHTTPPRVPRLAFAGWMNSFRSPIGAEIQALWIAACIAGVLQPSARDSGRSVQVFALTHDRAAARRIPQFSSGAAILDLDVWIEEAGLRVPAGTRIRELLTPLDPESYSGLLPQLQQRVALAAPRESAADEPAYAPGN